MKICVKQGTNDCMQLSDKVRKSLNRYLRLIEKDKEHVEIVNLIQIFMSESLSIEQGQNAVKRLEFLSANVRKNLLKYKPSKDLPSGMGMVVMYAEQEILPAAATCLLGYLYDVGLAVEKNSDYANNLYFTSALHGYALAFYKILINTHYQSPLDYKYSIAIDLLKKAEVLGYPAFIFKLAHCYSLGYIDKDTDIAFFFTTQAAELGYAAAQNELGLYYDKRGPDYFTGDYGLVTGYQKAREWYLKAVNQGFSDAEFNLGCILAEGYDIDIDLKKASELFEKSSKKGHISAQHMMGLHYCHGLGVEKDLQKAIHWYRIAVDNGNIKSMNNLAYCLEKIGGEENLILAFQLYKKAAEKGNLLAQQNFALCLLEGKVVPKDLRQAIDWFKKAYENQLLSAKKHLIDCLVQVLDLQIGKVFSYSETIELYKYAFSLGVTNAAYQLAELFSCLHPQNLFEAREYYKKFLLAHEQIKKENGEINYSEAFVKEAARTLETYIVLDEILERAKQSLEQFQVIMNGIMESRSMPIGILKIISEYAIEHFENIEKDMKDYEKKEHEEIQSDRLKNFVTNNDLLDDLFSPGKIILKNKVWGKQLVKLKKTRIEIEFHPITYAYLCDNSSMRPIVMSGETQSKLDSEVLEISKFQDVKKKI